MTSIKHDIKNDLAVIYAYAQLMGKKYRNSKEEISVIEKRVKEIEKKLELL